jgi:hypothetical protein
MHVDCGTLCWVPSTCGAIRQRCEQPTDISKVVYTCGPAESLRIFFSLGLAFLNCPEDLESVHAEYVLDSSFLVTESVKDRILASDLNGER